MPIKETTLTTITLPNRKHSTLIYRPNPDVNKFESIATLEVPVHEFWEIISKELGIKFVDKESK
jgi:hypothetical protein